ncbi:unnamed protein product [Symbiodinium sp. CCMP2592]|nr:unnamed protein product [Symbiodinium sp. CCMP2592]
MHLLETEQTDLVLEVEAASEVAGELLLEGAERLCKSKGEQRGHKRIALLATLGLGHEADEGKHGRSIGCVLELGQHGSAAHEVECTNAVDRKNNAAGIRIGLELKGVGESLSPSSCGQGELVGAGCFIYVSAELLGKCAGNQTGEEVSANQSTDATGWLAQCNEAAKAKCRSYGGGEEQSCDVGCESTGAGCSASARATQVGKQGRCRQRDRHLREPGQQIWVKRCVRLARAAVRVTQLLEGRLVARGKRLAEESATSGRELAQASKMDSPVSTMLSSRLGDWGSGRRRSSGSFSQECSPVTGRRGAACGRNNSNSMRGRNSHNFHARSDSMLVGAAAKDWMCDKARCMAWRSAPRKSLGGDRKVGQGCCNTWDAPNASRLANAARNRAPASGVSWTELGWIGARSEAGVWGCTGSSAASEACKGAGPPGAGDGEELDEEFAAEPGRWVGLAGCCGTLVCGGGSGGACACATCCTRWAAADSPRYTWSSASRYVPIGQDELAPCPWQVHECVGGQSIGSGGQAEEQLGLLHRHGASFARRKLLQDVQSVSEGVWWRRSGVEGSCPNVSIARMARPLLLALRVQSADGSMQQRNENPTVRRAGKAACRRGCVPWLLTCCLVWEDLSWWGLQCDPNRCAR